jgi:hypothetical protein
MIKSSDHYSMSKLSVMTAYKKISKLLILHTLKKAAWIFDHVLEFSYNITAVWFYPLLDPYLRRNKAYWRLQERMCYSKVGGLEWGDRKIVHNSKISNQNFIERKSILFIFLYTWFFLLLHSYSPLSPSPSKYSHIKVRAFLILFLLQWYAQITNACARKKFMGPIAPKTTWL